MVWSWSHSTEGLQNARANLEKMDRDDLDVIYAEWMMFEKYGKDANSADFARDYDGFLEEAERLPGDELCDAIWERAKALSNCENGGWEAHMCPFGCMSHMVPFSAPGEDEEEE